MTTEGSSPAPASTPLACPLTVAGTTATVENTVDGIVLVFATTPAGVDEVRQRIDRLAVLTNRSQAAEPPASAAKPVEGASTPEATVRVTATTERSAGGARLVLRPVDAAHMDGLRDRVRKQADAMLERTCDRETARLDGDGQGS